MRTILKSPEKRLWGRCERNGGLLNESRKWHLIILCWNNMLLLMEMWMNEKAHLFDVGSRVQREQPVYLFINHSPNISQNRLHVLPTIHKWSSRSEINVDSGWKPPFTVQQSTPDMKNERRKNTPLIIDVSLFTFHLVEYKVINRSCRPWCFYRIGEKNWSNKVFDQKQKGECEPETAGHSVQLWVQTTNTKHTKCVILIMIIITFLKKNISDIFAFNIWKQQSIVDRKSTQSREF